MLLLLLMLMLFDSLDDGDDLIRLCSNNWVCVNEDGDGLGGGGGGGG